MKKIDVIYFDMDDVLVDHRSGLALMNGMTLEEFEAENKRYQFAKKHPDDMDYIVDRIQAHLGKGCFIHTPPTTEFYLFKQHIELWIKERYHVEILSSATKQTHLYDEICRQKTAWLENHGLGLLPRHYARGGKEKQKWAREDTLLIDDFHKNIGQFREAGGNAIHHVSVIETLKQAEELGLPVLI